MRPAWGVPYDPGRLKFGQKEKNFKIDTMFYPLTQILYPWTDLWLQVCCEGIFSNSMQARSKEHSVFYNSVSCVFYPILPFISTTESNVETQELLMYFSWNYRACTSIEAGVVWKIGKIHFDGFPRKLNCDVDLDLWDTVLYLFAMNRLIPPNDVQINLKSVNNVCDRYFLYFKGIKLYS